MQRKHVTSYLDLHKHKRAKCPPLPEFEHLEQQKRYQVLIKRVSIEFVCDGAVDFLCSRCVLVALIISVTCGVISKELHHKQIT